MCVTVHHSTAIELQDTFLARLALRIVLHFDVEALGVLQYDIIGIEMTAFRFVVVGVRTAGEIAQVDRIAHLARRGVGYILGGPVIQVSNCGVVQDHRYAEIDIRSFLWGVLPVTVRGHSLLPKVVRTGIRVALDRSVRN